MCGYLKKKINCVMFLEVIRFCWCIFIYSVGIYLYMVFIFKGLGFLVFSFLEGYVLCIGKINYFL